MRTSSQTTETDYYTRAANDDDICSGPGTRTKYGYDAGGNVTGYGASGFSYNAAGRLASATTLSGATIYLYNALGQRVKKASGGSATYFSYDEAGHLLGEYDQAGTPIEEIVWLGDIPIATVRLEPCGLSVFYIHTDHTNTPRRISRRSTAQLVWSWESDPFGAATPNENPSGLGTFSFNLRFPGQYFDVETGLNYNFFRDYDPAMGRYMEGDPLGIAAGVNPYVYVEGNPISSIDPMGLRPPTDAEIDFIKKYIGPCLDPKTLDIKQRRIGDTSRAVTFGNGFTSFPSYFFQGNSGVNELKLGTSYIASVVGHEALHQMQRASGVNVTGQGLGLQFKYSTGISDPYQYHPSPDPADMFDAFINGNVEQQGQIFQDYLFDLLSGHDVTSYIWIASYVKGNCACAK